MSFILILLHPNRYLDHVKTTGLEALGAVLGSIGAVDEAAKSTADLAEGGEKPRTDDTEQAEEQSAEPQQTAAKKVPASKTNVVARTASASKTGGVKPATVAAQPKKKTTPAVTVTKPTVTKKTSGKGSVEPRRASTSSDSSAPASSDDARKSATKKIVSKSKSSPIPATKQPTEVKAPVAKKLAVSRTYSPSRTEERANLRPCSCRRHERDVERPEGTTSSTAPRRNASPTKRVCERHPHAHERGKSFVNLIFRRKNNRGRKIGVFFPDPVE